MALANEQIPGGTNTPDNPPKKGFTASQTGGLTQGVYVPDVDPNFANEARAKAQLGPWEPTKFDEETEGRFSEWWNKDDGIQSWMRGVYESDKLNFRMQVDRNVGLNEKGTGAIGAAMFPSFEEWKGKFSPDSDRYDYRGAFEAGYTPDENGHWPSKGVGGKNLKSPVHPTRWKTDFMDVMGYDPDEAGVTKSEAYTLIGKNQGSKMNGENPDLWDAVHDYDMPTMEKIDLLEKNLVGLTKEKNRLDQMQSEAGMEGMFVGDVSTLNDVNERIESSKEQLLYLRGYKKELIEKVPDWVKAGFNESSIGLGMTIINGESPLRLSGAPMSFWEQAGASALGLIVFDAPLFLATGGVGALAGKTFTRAAIKYGAKKFIKAGISEKMAGELAKRSLVMAGGVRAGALKTGQAMAAGAANLGTFHAVSDGLRQYRDITIGDTDAFDYGQWMKEVGIGSTLGAGLGIIGSAGNSFRNYLSKSIEKEGIKKTSTIGAKGLETGAEIGWFWAGDAVLRGHHMDTEGLGMSAFTIGALKLSKGARQYMGLEKSANFEEPKAWTGIYDVPLGKNELRDLGYTSRESLIRAMKNPRALSEMLGDPEVPAYTKDKILWGSSGIMRTKDVTADRATKKVVNGEVVVEMKRGDMILSRMRMNTETEADILMQNFAKNRIDRERQNKMQDLTDDELVMLNETLADKYSDIMPMAEEAIVTLASMRTPDQQRIAKTIFDLGESIISRRDEGVPGRLGAIKVKEIPTDDYKAQGIQKSDKDVVFEGRIIPPTQKTPAELEQTISLGSHAIISAERGSLKFSENAARSNQMRDRLTEMGYDITETGGKWGGVAERSFIIEPPKDKTERQLVQDAMDLASEFGQDAVIVRDGLIDMKDGVMYPRMESRVEMNSRSKEDVTKVNMGGISAEVKNTYNFNERINLDNYLKGLEYDETMSKSVERGEVFKKKLNESMAALRIASGNSINMMVAPSQMGAFARIIQASAKKGYNHMEQEFLKAFPEWQKHFPKAAEYKPGEFPVRDALKNVYDDYKAMRLPSPGEPNVPIGNVEQNVVNLFGRSKSPTALQFKRLKIGAPKVPRAWDEIKRMADVAVKEFPQEANWYSDYGRAFSDVVGEKNMPEAGAIFGIISPQKSTDKNFAETLFIMNTARKVDPVKDPKGFEAALRAGYPNRGGKIVKPFITGDQIKNIIDLYKSGEYTAPLKTGTYAMQTAMMGGDPYTGFSVYDQFMARIFGHLTKRENKWIAELTESNTRVGIFLVDKLAQEYGVRADEMQAILWHYAQKYIKPDGKPQPKPLTRDKSAQDALDYSQDIIKDLSIDKDNQYPTFRGAEKRIDSQYNPVIKGTGAEKKKLSTYNTASYQNDLRQRKAAVSKEVPKEVKQEMSEAGVETDGENIILYRYDDAFRAEVDPAKITPTLRSKDEFTQWPLRRTFFYTNKSQKEGVVPGSVATEYRVPMRSVYDIDTDRLGIMEDARKLAELKRYSYNDINGRVKVEFPVDDVNAARQRYTGELSSFMPDIYDASAFGESKIGITIKTGTPAETQAKLKEMGIDGSWSSIEPRVDRVPSSQGEVSALIEAQKIAKDIGYSGFMYTHSAKTPTGVATGKIVTMWDKVYAGSRKNELSDRIAINLEELVGRLRGLNRAGESGLEGKGTTKLLIDTAKDIAELGWRNGVDNIKKYVFDDLKTRFSQYGIKDADLKKFESEYWDNIEAEVGKKYEASKKAETVNDKETDVVADAVESMRELAGGITKKQIGQKKGEIKDVVLDRRATLDKASFTANKLAFNLRKKLSERQRELLPFLLEDTPVPAELNRPDLEALWTDQQLHKAGMGDKAKTPDLSPVVDEVKSYYNEMWSRMMESFDFTDEAGIRNYVTHIWDTNKSSYGAAGGVFNTTTRFAKKRYIGTMMEGIQKGLVPKTTDISSIIKTYSRSVNRAIANRQFAEDMKNFTIDGAKMVLPGKEAPYGWVPVDHPAFSKTAYVPTKKGDTGTLRQAPMRTHPDFKKYLDLVLANPESTDIMKVYDAVAGIMKKTALSVSLFHHGALTETAVALVGPVKGAQFMGRIAANAAKGIPPAYANEKISIDAIDHGMQLGASSDIPVQKIQQWLDAAAKKTKNIPLLGYAAKAPALFNSKWDKGLWEYLHDGLKLYAYEHMASKIPATASPEMVKGRKREIAQLINDTFGGQNMEALFINPQMAKVYGRLLLSPDWTISTVRQALSPTGFGAVSKDMAKYRRRMGAMFWANAALFYGVGVNALNMYFREQDIKDNPELYEGNETFWNKTMFGNTTGHGTHLFIGRADSGEEVYLRWGKQFRELPELLMDPAKKIGGKANPLLNFGTEFFTGHTLSGFVNKDIAQAKGYDKYIGRAKTIAGAFVPFSARGMFDENRVGGAINIVMPAGKGMTAWTGTELMKKEMLPVFNGDRELDEQSLREIYMEARRNNLNPYAMMKGAMSSIKAELTKTLTEDIESLDDIETQLKEPGITRVDRARLLRKKRSLLVDINQKKRADKLFDPIMRKLNGELKIEGVDDAEFKKYTTPSKKDMDRAPAGGDLPFRTRK